MIGRSSKRRPRAKLERVLRYYDEGHVNLLIVTIIESADNENALVAPVIEPMHSVMTRRREWTEKGSEWLEAFDHLPPLMTILEVMRELDLFLENITRQVSRHDSGKQAEEAF